MPCHFSHIMVYNFDHMYRNGPYWNDWKKYRELSRDPRLIKAAIEKANAATKE